MNPYLEQLQPYPFERLNALFAPLSPTPTHPPVSLALGEPKHDAPQFLVQALTDPPTVRRGLGTYPPTRGSVELREAIAAWVLRRFGTELDPGSQVLPVNGTREALFSFGQAVLSGRPGSTVLMPNPFYQIYEGAAVLRGARPWYVPASDTPDFDAVPEAVWPRVELVFVCNPGNPSGQMGQRRGSRRPRPSRPRARLRHRRRRVLLGDLPRRGPATRGSP